MASANSSVALLRISDARRALTPLARLVAAPARGGGPGIGRAGTPARPPRRSLGGVIDHSPTAHESYVSFCYVD